MEADWIDHHSKKSLKRLLPRLDDIFDSRPGAVAAHRRQAFEERLHRHWEPLFRLLVNLYGWHYDFYYHLEQILISTARAWLERPEVLKELDVRREENPDWFLSQEMVGGVLYVDLFSDNLARLSEHIPYFKQLGLTYLHLMPLFAMPHGDNDGGYAVSDYRAVNPDIGTMDQLTELAQALRRAGISLVLDFVFNHTSNEHIWARRAQTGDPDYQEYYFLFPDREMPDRYERTLRDIFPSLRRGCFTWHEGCRKWVWTTFNSFQWDLNYSNPDVFRSMVEEMLFLANHGVEVLRLDAVAFIWKQLGTSCENRPEAHMVIRAFNLIARIAAPALLFKSEAIVHPDEVIKYVDRHECQLSYNPLLMALLWEAVATREVKLLARAMQNRSRLPDGCSWANYLRCHDDIGWTFDDLDAAQVGIDPAGHRRFLNDFFTGRFPGSFARGFPFQFDPGSGDQRVCGTLASLAGLEKAVEENDPQQIETAVRRINMLRSIILSIGGIPLIYLGEEWGELNDYTFLSDPAKASDARWIQRSKKKWQSREKLNDPSTLEWRFFDEIFRLIKLRKSLPAFYDGGMQVIDTGNPHLFGYTRQTADQYLLIVNNFSETPQTMSTRALRACGCGRSSTNLITGTILDTEAALQLGGYGFVWLDCSAPADTGDSR
ncbi:MAG: alpha-amylase family glycosyl hydrolase [Desulfobacterales bacterium]|jgi:amylosucrase